MSARDHEMASSLSVLAFENAEMPPGRMVNVAAHGSITLLRTFGPSQYQDLEQVLELRETTKTVQPQVYLNVQRMAVLGGIGMELNVVRFGAGQVRIEIEVPQALASTAPPVTQVVTVLVFDSGKLIFTGGENEFVTQLAAWQFVHMLARRFRIPVTLSCFRINNIVFNYFLNFRVDLRRFQTSEGILCEYNPIKFPAVVYKFGEKFKALVNYTGRVIITGARDRETVGEAYVRLYRKLHKFRTADGPPALTGPAGSTALVPVGHARQTPYPTTEEQSDSFMRMNQQLAVMVQSFTQTEVEAIDDTAPEMRLGPYMRECALELATARAKRMRSVTHAGPHKRAKKE